MMDVILNLGSGLKVLNNPKLEGILLDVITQKINSAFKKQEKSQSPKQFIMIEENKEDEGIRDGLNKIRSDTT